jgi:hypothetical protein
MNRQFKSKPTVQNKSLRIKIPQINFVEKFVEFLKINFVQASNQSDLDLSDEKAIQIQADCSQQVTPNKNSSNFIENFVKADDLEYLKIFVQASNQ